MSVHSSTSAERIFNFGNGSTVILKGTEAGQVAVLVETPEGATLVRIPSDVAAFIATALKSEAAWAEAQEPTHFIGGCRVFQRRDGMWTREGYADCWPTKYGPAGYEPRSCFKKEGQIRHQSLSPSKSPVQADPKPWSAPSVSQGHGEADAVQL